MTYDLAIIGGGIVGFATAMTIQKRFPDLKVCLIEKEAEAALHQTGNNSGVIHSGLYYKPGSYKAKNCVSGYQMLVDYCETKEIAYELCGKLVVATQDSEVAALNTLFERAMANGLNEVRRLGTSELKEYEPHVNGIAALNVPYTGIVDYKAVTRSFQSDFEEAGGQTAFSSQLKEIVKEKDQHFRLVTSKAEYKARFVINCAGLYSDKIAKLTGQKVDFKIIPFRGEYYELRPERHYLVKNLIYPVPDPAFPFLGVHFTRMIGGGVEAGPNAVLAFAREGYKKSSISPSELLETLTYPGFLKIASKYWQTGMGEMYRSFSKSAFTAALQKLLPELKEEDLIPGGAGVRAQACTRKGELVDDFLVLQDKGVINVCNAPSPAATSSLAIADQITKYFSDQYEKPAAL
ncbi:MAG: L-2-hydroxyglutarate oxidase [Cyclobacteriaceae bacterium]|nr:L-2-hydroxyglutarate oxidase [Cyclobacteriaceae bacterium]MCH8515211.1 L-2-hydroxyglutarate oxidase [Cyclobacteriaceae bacterium]